LAIANMIPIEPPNSGPNTLDLIPQSGSFFQTSFRVAFFAYRNLHNKVGTAWRSDKKNFKICFYY
jgi:hypothetical protein